MKYHVVDVDGKDRGGLFDSRDAKDSWNASPTADRFETMVCQKSRDQPSWILLEIVRDAKPSYEFDSENPVDPDSLARLMLPPQAYRWFVSRELDPPPVLVDQVRSFATTWNGIREKKTLLYLLDCFKESHRTFLRRDELLAEASLEGEELLDALIELEIVNPCESNGETTWFLRPCYEEMGATGCVDWIDRVLRSIPDLEGDGKDITEEPSSKEPMPDREATSDRAARRTQQMQDLKALGIAPGIQEWALKAWRILPRDGKVRLDAVMRELGASSSDRSAIKKALRGLLETGWAWHPTPQTWARRDRD